MYELLLKWGVDNLVGLARAKDGRDVAILVEAVRAKNALVIERFKHAWEACQAIVDLSISVEEALDSFAGPVTDNTPERAREFVGALKANLHPKFYRRLKKARSRFESTNDLLSAYSWTLADIVHIDMLETIVARKQRYGATFIRRNYRGLWTLYSELLTSLLRVTSADLRFWLTDAPYVEVADGFAQEELKTVREFLLAESWNGKRLHLSIETPAGLERFWSAVGPSAA